MDTRFRGIRSNTCLGTTPSTTIYTVRLRSDSTRGEPDGSPHDADQIAGLKSNFSQVRSPGFSCCPEFVSLSPRLSSQPYFIHFECAHGVYLNPVIHAALTRFLQLFLGNSNDSRRVQREEEQTVSLRETHPVCRERAQRACRDSDECTERDGVEGGVEDGGLGGQIPLSFLYTIILLV